MTDDAALRAEHFLRELLSQGRAQEGTAVTRQAKACGITPSRLEQAAQRLGAISDCPLGHEGLCLFVESR